MSLTTSHRVSADRASVWRWHERPGAVTRLTPSFLPMTPLREADNLADGTTVFDLPAGLRWVARHDPSAFSARHSFADACVNAPLAGWTRWRHHHDFHDAPARQAGSPAQTVITDRVHTRAPAGLIAPAFAYRQHQLQADLAALARLREIAAGHGREVPADRPFDLPQITVALTGSHGTVGTSLAAQLGTAGVRVIPLVRSSPGDGERLWDPDDPDPHLLDGVDALVHPAGAPIMGRFTEAHKKKLRDSRLGPTRRLAQLVAASPDCQVMVTASAVGFYGPSRGDEVLSEDSPRGGGFLADLVADWEAACSPAAEAGKRVVNVRTGLAMSGRGGLLPLYRAMFSSFFGGPLDGDAWMPWIALDDLTDIYARAIVDDALHGPVNAAAPNPVRGRDFAAALGEALNRPSSFPVPAFGPKLLLGSQGAEELALADQRVVPERLTAAGHTFRYPDLSAVLAHELGKEPLAEYAPQDR